MEPKPCPRVLVQIAHLCFFEFSNWVKNLAHGFYRFCCDLVLKKHFEFFWNGLLSIQTQSLTDARDLAWHALCTMRYNAAKCVLNPMKTLIFPLFLMGLMLFSTIFRVIDLNNSKKKSPAAGCRIAAWQFFCFSL